jgi:sec-independent protein translocase protein TatA
MYLFCHQKTYLCTNIKTQIMINDIVLLGMLGGNEVIIVLAIILLLFGGRKIPELMRGLGKGVKEFKNATNDIKEEINDIDPTKELRK